MFYYSANMLNGIKIYSSDEIWRQILSDLGATLCDTPDATCLDFDALDISLPATPLAIKTAVMRAMDGNIRILTHIFGHAVSLPHIQAQIVILLYRSGGMTSGDLRTALGYSPNATTHTVDTAIYQLRRTFGRDFIQNENGVYKLGRV